MMKDGGMYGRLHSTSYSRPHVGQHGGSPGSWHSEPHGGLNSEWHGRPHSEEHSGPQSRLHGGPHKRRPPVGARGFTLMEVMVVVVLIAVLLVIGLPSYRNYVIKANRSEGTAELIRLMDRQERYYANQFPPTYADDLKKLGFANTTFETENGHYAITAGTCGTGSSAPAITACVQLTATAQGAQTDDGNLTLDSRGNKTRDGSAGWRLSESP